MTVARALEQVGSLYAPGVAEHYARFGAMDPWQEAHRDLETASLSGDADLIDLATTGFVERCRSLVEDFKRMGAAAGPRRPHLSIADCFAIGDEARVRAIQSVKYRECVHCENKNDLTLEAIGPEAMQVQVICRKCKGSGYGTSS